MYIRFDINQSQILGGGLILFLIYENADSHVRDARTYTVDALERTEYLKHRLFAPDTSGISLEFLADQLRQRNNGLCRLIGEARFSGQLTQSLLKFKRCQAADLPGVQLTPLLTQMPR